MRYRKLHPWILTLALVSLGEDAVAEQRLLNRSIFMPVEFVLCEHLEKAVFFEHDQPVSTMPARRVFQFTYYPDLQRMLPEVVQVRVEGTYVSGGDPFVARLALTPDGIHTAHRTKVLDTVEKMKKQRHKIDVRLEKRTLLLQCERFCVRSRTVASANGLIQ